jgi:hypothetical protein
MLTGSVAVWSSMFLRANYRSKDGKRHSYWSLVETLRTADGVRQRTLCSLGELNGSTEARWLKTIEVFNEQGESRQLKLFPAEIEPPADDPAVARILVHQVRMERSRRLGLEEFLEQRLDGERAEVPWSRVAAVLAIEKRWYPSTALEDLLEIPQGQINDTRLYRCLDRLLPQKTALEQHLRQRYGELLAAEFDVLLYDLTNSYVWKGPRLTTR